MFSGLAASGLAAGRSRLSYGMPAALLIHTVALAVLLLLPLLATEPLPRWDIPVLTLQVARGGLIPPPPFTPPPTPQPPRYGTGRRGFHPPPGGRVVSTRIPDSVPEDSGPGEFAEWLPGTGSGGPGDFPGGSSPGFVPVAVDLTRAGWWSSAQEPPPPPPPPARPPEGKPVPVEGRVMTARLLRSVLPEYPLIARQAGVEGTVVLQVTVDESGRVAAARVVRGHPLFDAAALRAVRDWVYAPMMLNGSPVAVVGTVTVRFTLAR